MKTFLLGVLFILPSLLYAEPYMDLEVRKIQTLRHAYHPDRTSWRGYVGLNWGRDDKHWFFRNRSYFYGDKSAVRHIGWEYTLGAKINRFEIFYYHHSEHRADDRHPNEQKFPLQDSIGLRVDLLK